MPYALFCQETKISKAYPTEAEVWKHAAQNGLVVDIETPEGQPTLRRMLDNSYEIKPCGPDAVSKSDPNATDFELEGIVTT